MDVFIGIDVAKEVHWACAMDRTVRAQECRPRQVGTPCIAVARAR
ncbi:hypothetical protein P1J78_24875 [Psychromarinibacter sp. C21-152]|uniref:Transposase n=1 Tax=Psychromarinibacter sediminicola TaxID=3033385 RepID=A0AAE3NXT2_9RHOB|nr:hypothetical protein [Psychromarinibacter sediminicola]MDF0603946.1 hypothetical protein [Psychromarinibacter sediminicola]